MVRIAGLLLALAVPTAASAQASAEGRLRVPFGIEGGWDAPAGTGALMVGIESAGGWGLGVSLGLSDATPGTRHQHWGAYGRLPLWRAGRLELAGRVFFSRADRERETREFNRFLRWEWRPAYRLDAGLGARLRLASWALRLEAGLGYLLNAPGCDLITDDGDYVETSCGDPRVPAAADATGVGHRLAPYLSVAAEYDLIAPGPEGTPEPSRWPRRDGRETNGWLAATALTLPRGELRVTLYELIVPEVAYGVTDRFQLAVLFGLIPPARGIQTVWRGEARYQVWSGRFFRFALLGGGFGYTAENNADGTFLGGGGVVSLCFDVDCESLASLGFQAGSESVDPDEGESSKRTTMLVNPTLIVRLSDRVKLVGEVHGFVGDRELVALGMLRFPFARFSLEVGSLVGLDYFLPIGSVSVRF